MVKYSSQFTIVVEVLIARKALVSVDNFECIASRSDRSGRLDCDSCLPCLDHEHWKRIEVFQFLLKIVSQKNLQVKAKTSSFGKPVFTRVGGVFLHFFARGAILVNVFLLFYSRV